MQKVKNLINDIEIPLINYTISGNILIYRFQPAEIIFLFTFCVFTSDVLWVGFVNEDIVHGLLL